MVAATGTARQKRYMLFLNKLFLEVLDNNYFSFVAVKRPILFLNCGFIFRFNLSSAFVYAFNVLSADFDIGGVA